MKNEHLLVYVGKASPQTTAIIEAELGKFSTVASDHQAIDPNATTIIINSQCNDWQEQLAEIRMTDEHFLTPIFLDTTTANHDELNLIDGDLSDIDQVKSCLKKIRLQCDKITPPQQCDWRFKVLAYLFTRPQLSLMPHIDSHHQHYYCYPLIDFFNREKEDYNLWLEQLLEQKIFFHGKIVQNIFTCPNCESAQLMFSERCPNCNSVNIEEKEFLHCFSCGLVSPLHDFISKERLICPKCHNQLKHIGDDYDKPLETGECLNCNQYYLDSNVYVNCVHCGNDYASDYLKKRKVYEIKLTQHHDAQAIFAWLENPWQVFDNLNYAQANFFYAMLDWSIAMQKRYHNHNVSLLGIKLPDIHANISSNCQEIAKHLSEILYETDILTRIQERYLWILLPHTNHQQLDKIKQRITTISQKIIHNKQLKMIDRHSTDQSSLTSPARELIARLMTELQ